MNVRRQIVCEVVVLLDSGFDIIAVPVDVVSNISLHHRVVSAVHNIASEVGLDHTFSNLSNFSSAVLRPAFASTLYPIISSVDAMEETVLMT